MAVLNRWHLTLVLVWTLTGAPFSSASANQLQEQQQAPCSAALESVYQTFRSNKNWWARHFLSRQHLRVVHEFTTEIEEASDNDPQLRDPQFVEVLKRLITHPQGQLTAQDLEIIGQHPARRRVVVGTLQMFAVAESQYRVVQRLGQYWSWRASNLDFAKEVGWKKKALRALQSFYNGPLRFLVPAPILPRINTPTDTIFIKQSENPQMWLSPAEQQTLKKYDAEDAFEQRKEFLTSRPLWSRFRRWVRIAAVAMLTTNSAMAINYGLHLSAPGALVPANEFLAASEQRLGTKQVRIYNETVPFPHMAIEMGGVVYSYGQTHMRTTAVREYLLADDINRMMRERFGATNEPKTWVEKGFALTGLSHLNRSVQMITLNLTQEQHDQLKRNLELATGKAYRNITFSMDCATMIVLALKGVDAVYIPEIIDASPSVVMMYLAALKSLGALNADGQPLVGEIQQVSSEAVQNPDLHVLRNLYINAMEGQLFTVLLPYNAVPRVYLEARYGKDGFQYWNPEVRAVIESWQNTVDDDLRNSDVGQQLAVLREKALELGRAAMALGNPATRTEFSPSPADSDEWQTKRHRFYEVVEYFIAREQKLDSERLQSPETAFEDIMRAAYRHEALASAKQELRDLAEGRTPQSLRASASSILDTVSRRPSLQ